MTDRASKLIRLLDLEPHPEGGHFREVFRSGDDVRPDDEREARPAQTAIYYLLRAGEFSRWHQLRSEEVWHFYEGEPLELLTCDAEFTRVHRQILGFTGDGQAQIGPVARDHWQAARSLGSYSLAGCTVSPGFVPDDFKLLADHPDELALMRRRLPDLADLC